MKLIFKRVIAVVLALSMVLCFAACGEEKSKHPDYIYEASFEPLSFEGIDGFNVLNVGKKGIYITTWNYDDETYSGYQNLYQISFDGELSAFDAYTQPLDTTDKDKYDSYSYDVSICSLEEMKNEENYVLIENVYQSWNDAPSSISPEDDRYWDYYHYENNFLIRVIDKKGNEIRSSKFESDNDYFYFNHIVLDENNNIVTVSDNSVYVISLEGKILSKMDIAAADDYSNWVNNLVELKDGRVAAYIVGDNSKLQIIDTAAGKLGDSIDITTSAYNMYPGTEDYDLYYSTDLYFYGYKIASKTSDELFSWLDLSIDANNLQGTTVLDDGTIKAISYGEMYVSNMKTADIIGPVQSDSNCELITITKKPYEQTSEKTELTLACYYLNWDVKNSIMDFNKTNSKYKIKVIDYSEGVDDYEAGMMKFNTELISGNVPDIIALSEINTKRLVAAGVLEDLYPYIEKDSEINKEDFFPNVLKAAEIDGKLYTTVSKINVITLLGASKLVGDIPGWTYSDLYEALAKMPEGCDILDQYITKENMLQMLLILNMNDLVDWTTGKCNFNSQEFIDALKFTEHFPLTYDYDEMEEYESTDERVQKGKQMLVEFYASSISDLIWADYEQTFGGDYTYIGFPSNDRDGSILYLADGYGISAKSKNKDAAWEFIRQFMTEDYMSSDEYSLPANKKVYDQSVDKYTHIQYQMDENGEYELDENGEKIPMAIGGYWDSKKQEYVQTYTVDQGKIDRLTNLITSATKAANVDQEILTIVLDQVEGYFNGTTTAEKTAEAIQNKVELYVNEQR